MESLKSLYHADKTDEQTFIENFTIRLKEYQQIINNLYQQKRKPLQHFLITGKRGMGKSTLLRRLYIEASKPPISDKLFAVRLADEKYRLSRLFKLWELVIEHLAQQDPKLLNQKKALEESRNYEEAILHIITDYLAISKKTLLVLIDNFDLFIEKLSVKEQHALRETLIQYPVQIIGNTVFYNEHFKSYDKPFFDFFKVVKLGNLDKDEAEDFIKQRAASEGIENFEELFKKQYSKITTLRILSGGVPRTLIILLGILYKQNTGDAVDYLQEMVEQVTPLYQDRMKALSPQQQEIMHHLAMHWDRTPVKDLAADMRLPSKNISAQLVQLEAIGYINRVDIPGRNHYYEIDERFFNIWLLMSEAQPYDTKRVIWLTRWLDAFYDAEELRRYADHCNQNLKQSKPGNRFLIAQALSESEKLDDGYKRYLVEETANELKDIVTEAKTWADAFKLKLTSKENKLVTEISVLLEQLEFEIALKKLGELEKLNPGLASFGKGVVNQELGNIDESIEYYLKASENGHVESMYNLANLYKNERNDLGKAEKYYLLAVKEGYVNAMYNLANLYINQKNDIDNAEKYYLMAVEHGHRDAMNNLAILYKKYKKDIDAAEKYYLMAVENGSEKAIFNLAIFYEESKRNTLAAEKYYLLAVQKGNADAMFNLALFYENEKNDIPGAEKYYLLAVDKNDSDAMQNLANLYLRTNNIDKKEKALSLSKRGIELEKRNNIVGLLIYLRILLWNEQIKQAGDLMIEILNGSMHRQENMPQISLGLQRFLVFRQKQFLYKLFNDTSDLADKYKPVYYALMYEMQDELPKEYLKMTEELKEPVEAILRDIKDEQERLGV